MLKRLGIAAGALAIAAACGSDPTAPSDFECSTVGQVAFVRATLDDVYFWYPELPRLGLFGFPSPEAYLDAVRYRPLDSSFSYVADKASSEAFFSESQFIGIGLSTQRTGESELRVTVAFPDSPASEAGLRRGHFLLAINGKTVPDLLRTGEIGTIFGPDQAGVAVDLLWADGQGGRRQATLVKRAVTIPTVSATRVLDVGGQRVGYLHFRNFVRPSIDALGTAFRQLGAQGATDLVLDLRYNGGGLVSVAQRLGGLVGGKGTGGQVFVRFTHNDKNAHRDSVLSFESPEEALDLPRLVVITTRASASASEVVINALRPFMPVTVVGATTFGKPVGQYGFDFCDKVVFPVAFQLRNARGEGDYFGGIPADCAAPDDLDHELGDPGEGSLAEALHYLRAGSCSARAPLAARALARQRAQVAALPADGWQQLLGAQ